MRVFQECRHGFSTGLNNGRDHNNDPALAQFFSSYF